MNFTVSDLFSELATISVYAVLGAALMALGFVVIDLLTPGRLAYLIWRERNTNAAVLATSNTLSVGLIVVTAIRSSHEGLTEGLSSTLAYSLLGLLLMAISFAVLDKLTPGKHGAIVVDAKPHPAVWVSAAMHLALAAVICASMG